MKSVLLFGSMGSIGQVAKQSLEKYGAKVTLVEFSQNTLRDEAGYRRELIKGINSFSPDIIMPVGNSVALSRYAPVLRKMFPRMRIAVESAGKVELLDSKVRLYEYAQNLGTELPHRYFSAEEVPQGQRVIFKKDTSFGGQGVRVPRNLEALRNLIIHNGDSPYLIEDFVDGQEYSVDVIRYSEKVEVSSYRCFKSGGTRPASERETVSIPPLEACSIKILETLEYKGICGFDFMVTEDGGHYLLEANPRFTGGLQTQIASGFDIPVKLLSIDW